MSTQPTAYYSRYTDNDIRFIRRNYHLMTDKQIADKLNRTPKGIDRLRKKMGYMKEVNPEKPGSKKRNLFRSTEINLLKKFIKKSNTPIWNDIARQRIEYLECIILGEK